MNITALSWPSVEAFMRFNYWTEPSLYLLAVIGNSLTLAAVCTSLQLRTLANALLVSLALADCLSGLIGFIIGSSIME